MEEEVKDTNAIVTPKTVEIYSAFGVTLKRIHMRLIAEGYIIKDGIITKSEKLQEIEADDTLPKKSPRARKKRVIDDFLQGRCSL